MISLKTNQQLLNNFLLNYIKIKFYKKMQKEDYEFLFTSEQVSYGHPDKFCDLISDSLLDAFLSQDENAKCGIEVLAKNNTVVLAGEINSTALVDYEKVVKDACIKIGIRHNRIQGTVEKLKSDAAMNIEEADCSTAVVSDVMQNYSDNCLLRNETINNKDNVFEPVKLVVGVDASVDQGTIAIAGAIYN